MCSLKNGWGQFLFAWTLWIIVMYTFYIYMLALGQSTDLGRVQAEITEKMTVKDLLSAKSWCDYPEWRAVAIKTGDISLCEK